MTSDGGELFALGAGAATEPAFETALRGYDKRQVDRYVAQAEHDITTLAAEREQAYAQIHALATQVEQLQIDLSTASRREPETIETVRFRHLGPRVEQILALAEDQADAIRASATDDIDARRAEADRILG